MADIILKDINGNNRVLSNVSELEFNTVDNKYASFFETCAKINLTNLLSTDTVTIEDPNGNIITPTWDSENNYWVADNLYVKGTYIATAVRGALSRIRNILVDVFTEYTIPCKISALPADYTEIEYMQATGTQVIRTNYLTTQTFKFYCKVAITDTSTSTDIWPALMGAQYLSNGSDGKYYVIGYTPSTRKVLGVTYTIGDIYELTYKLGEQSVNGVISSNSKTWRGAPYTHVLFFNRSTSDTGLTNSQYRVFAKLYSAKIWESDALVHEYIPCKSNVAVTGYKGTTSVSVGANTVGLYDITENKFYVNIGTGTFIAGPEV